MANTDTEPDVAITRIFGPELSTQQAPESGGAGSAGTSYDTANLLNPKAGPVIVSASNLYDPVTGQTVQNPLSVYVVASDEGNIEQVALYQDGTFIGTRTKAEDGIAFKNPFIFPKPGNAQSSVTIQGTSSGLLSTQLRASATDSSGQVVESAPLEVQVDGSRPDLNVSVSGDGPPYSSAELVTVMGSAADPETGIKSFDVTLNGTSVPVNASDSFSTTETFTAGTQTVVLTAVNGVLVPNQLTYTFEVKEPAPPTDPTNPGNPGGGTGNQAPTVVLTANPPFGDAPLSVIFTANARDDENDKLSYSWDFGNGSTASSGETQSAVYTASGTYTTSVTVSDGVNSPVTATATVIVNGDDGSGGGGNGGGTGNGAPSVSLEATPTSGSAPLTVNLTATATDPEDDAISYSWNFDNGETADSSSSQSVTYSEDGTYTAEVIVSDGNGGTSTATATITVGTDTGGGSGGGNDQPEVSIGGDEQRTATVGEAQNLEASTTNLGDDVTFEWRVIETTGDATQVFFGDAAAENTTVKFGAAGSYTLTLTATSSDGLTASDSVTFVVEDGNDGGGNNGGVAAVDDRKGTTRNQAVTLNVLANDKPGVKELVVIAATSPKQGGKVEITRDSRNIVYTPPQGFTGTDTFKYTVSDGKGHTARAVVTIRVR